LQRCGEVADERGSGEQFQAVLLHYGEEFQGHAARPLGARLPLFDGGLAGVEIASEDGWLTPWRSRSFLISRGLMGAGTDRQEASKLRMVALSMVPARYMPETLLWMASKASLLYLCFIVIGYFP